MLIPSNSDSTSPSPPFDGGPTLGQSTMFRSRREENDSTTYNSYVTKLAFQRSHQPLPDTLPYDSRLIRTRLGHYYLAIPLPIQKRSDNKAPNQQKSATVALDPGDRTFMTGYDADGYVHQWGVGDMTRIFRLCSRYDQLQSHWSRERMFGIISGIE